MTATYLKFEVIKCDCGCGCGCGCHLGIDSLWLETLEDITDVNIIYPIYNAELNFLKLYEDGYDE